MKKTIWLVLAVVAIGAVAVSLIALPREAQWTTDSPEARLEFEAGLDAMMKLYHPEATEHLERALEIDPDFLIAKLFLADQVKMMDEERAKGLREEVLAADAAGLSPRERLMVERTRAIAEERSDDARKMMDDYLASNPDDPYILHQKAIRFWGAGDYDEAELLNRRLIEIAPNWVISYNQLGYISMSRGRFVEAEEYFTSYRFVAPDQANPHDSLGELYIILGRYEEAENSVRRSIEIKPDFWAAYDHLALVRMAMGDLDGVEEVLAMTEAIGGCPDYWTTGMRCKLDYARLAESDQRQALLAAAREESTCFEGLAQGYVKVNVHRAACLEGDWELAAEIEDGLAKMGANLQDGSLKGEAPAVIGMQAHLRGVRLAVKGDLAGAGESFEDADRHLNYVPAGNGLFKLYNRLFLVETMLASGEDGMAHKLLSKVRSVNPRLVEEFEDEGHQFLGLER